jgi:phosphate-selective porin OprO and OprP
MFTNWRLSSAVSIATILATGSASAQTATVSPDQIEKLEAQIIALEREVQNLKKKAAAAERAEKTKKVDRIEAWETNTTGTYKAERRTAETSPKVKELGEETLLRAPAEREEERRAAKPAMTETPMAGVVTFRDGRPTLTSSDGRMSLAIGEQFQYDVGGYFQNRHSGVFQPPGARELNDGENLRRGRIYFVATFDNWTLRVTPDFGGFPDGAPTLFEGNLNYTIDPVTFTIGYFKPYDTLARSQFPADALFMERPSSALIASNVADGIRRASAGFKAATEDYFIASYLTGQFYGAQMPVFLNDTQTSGTLRLATRLFRGEDWNLHVGFSGSKVFHFNDSIFQPGGTVPGIRLSDQPELRIDMNSLIDTGFIPAKTADTWGFELAANWRNFLLEGEYIRVDVDPTVGSGLTFNGWYVEGSWILTGESRPYIASSASYGSPKPAHPFLLSPGGGRGAWELAGRYSVSDLNSGTIFGGKQEIASAGLSWYPNDHVRFLLQGSHVDVDRLDSTGRFQVGQSFWDIGLRSQVVY